MAFTIEDIADGVVVRVCDARLDAAQAIHFKDRLRDVVGRNGPLILLDLGKVDFMDSSGLGAMIAVHKAMPPGVTLSLMGLTPNVARVFRLTRMDSVFTILPANAEREEKRA